MTSMARDLAALAELDTHTLAEKYATLFGRPPRSRNRLHLLRRVAWKVQAERFGGLSATAQKQLDALMAQIEIPSAAPAATNAPALVREWHGKRIVARPIEGGFEFEGNVYRSLSAVAKAATGAHWNGRLFFRLKERAS